MDGGAAAVTLLGFTVLLVLGMLLTPAAGRIWRSCCDALMAVGVIAVAFDVAMLATSHADPVSGVLLFGCGTVVLAVVPVQRRRLRRHLQASQERLDQARHSRLPGR